MAASSFGVKREFTVVLLATAYDALLSPLCEEGGASAEGGRIKPLLPIAGRPLISYQFELLIRTGFKHVLVVTSSSTADQIRAVIESLPVQLAKGIESEVVRLDDGLRTVDILIALHKAPDKYLQGEVLIMSSDLVVDASMSLQKLIDKHRQRGSSLTVLLHNIPPLDRNRRRARIKEEESGSADHINYIGLAPDGRLLLFAKSSDLNQKGLSVSKKLIRMFPTVTVSNTLLDAHCYVLASWVPEFLATNLATDENLALKLVDIKADLIPFLVQKQFSRSFASSRQPDLEALSFSHSSHAATDPSSFKCFAYTLESGYCARSNTIQSFVDLNRDVAAGLNDYRPWVGRSQTQPEENNVYADLTATIEGAQLGNGIVIDSGSSLRNCEVDKSVIGRGCTISPGAVIRGSVIMDRVTIGPGVTIEGSVVCSDARVAKPDGQISISNCVIGYSSQIRTSHKDTFA